MSMDNGGGFADEQQSAGGNLKEGVRGVAGQVREEAGNLAGQARSEAGELLGEVRQRVGEVYGEARHKAEEVIGDARQRAGDMLTEHKSAAAEQIASIAGAIRDSAERLGEQETVAPVARYARHAADGLDRLADTFRSRDLETLMRDARGFAERQPALFFAGAALTGFLVARFLKSTAQGAGSGAQTASRGNPLVG